jgi:hypothetical protein
MPEIPRSVRWCQRIPRSHSCEPERAATPPLRKTWKRSTGASSDQRGFQTPASRSRSRRTRQASATDSWEDSATIAKRKNDRNALLRETREETVLGRWWSRQGSNLRPSHCERDALPTELRPHPPSTSAVTAAFSELLQCLELAVRRRTARIMETRWLLASRFPGNRGFPAPLRSGGRLACRRGGRPAPRNAGFMVPMRVTAVPRLGACSADRPTGSRGSWRSRPSS